MILVSHQLRASENLPKVPKNFQNQCIPFQSAQNEVIVDIIAIARTGVETTTKIHEHLGMLSKCVTVCWRSKVM